MIATAQQIIDSARPAIRHDTDQQVTDAQLLIWLGEHVRGLHSMAARLAKNLYTQSAVFTVSSGNTVTVGSGALAAVPANTYLDFRGLDFDLGGGMYQPVKPLAFRGRQRPSGRRYLLRGNSLDLYPSLDATGTYRLWYLATPMTVTVPVAGTSFDLPEGGDLWLAQSLCARARARFQQDPGPHVGECGRIWSEVIKPWLIARNAAGGTMIAQVEDATVGGDTGVTAAREDLAIRNLIPAQGDGSLGPSFTASTSAIATAGRLLVWSILLRHGAIASVSGAGLTWNLEATSDAPPSGVNSNERLFIYTATPTTNVSLADLTVTFSGSPINVIMSVEEIAGTTGVQEGGGGSGTGTSVGASSFSGTGLVLDVLGLAAASTGVTPGAGLTALSNHDVGAVQLRVAYALSAGATPGWSWTGSSAWSDLCLLFGDA